MVVQFEKLACRGYNVLRKNAQLIVTLFSLMLSCGIPELRSESDIIPLLEALRVGDTDEEAEQHFKQLIREAMRGRNAFLTRTLMDGAHIVKRG